MKAKIKIEFVTDIEIYPSKKLNKKIFNKMLKDIKSHLKSFKNSPDYSFIINKGTIDFKYSRGHKIRVGQWLKKI